ncbi:hypothetical protein RDI58_019373 [Solanum bulbocastanum]|uniref:Cotton fiber protein n=1 Tax=Solanum bulbocastanum TaxID=147425 RepID=A0AAN8TAG8_SOLBU
MKTQNWSLLKSLMSKATMKITFLLHKWKLTSRRKHPIKLFKKSKSSLYDAIRNIDDEFEEQEGPCTHCIRRTKSNNNDDDEMDVDQRAEMFIANFRRQLRLERQISLELRYCK